MLPLMGYAQAPPPPPPGLSIDGAVKVLFLVGIIYASKKIINK